MDEQNPVDASDIFERLIKSAHEQQKNSIGGQFVSTEDMDRVNKFLSNEENKKALLALVDRNHRVFGVVCEVRTEADDRGMVEYFDESGFRMGFGYDLSMDRFKNIDSFQMGDILSMDINGLEMKSVTTVDLPIELKKAVIEKIKKAYDHRERP